MESVSNPSFMPDGWLDGAGISHEEGPQQGDVQQQGEVPGQGPGVTDASRDDRPVPGTTYHATEPLAPAEPRLGVLAALGRRLGLISRD